ncbi:DUF1838 family protein [Pseudomonas wadenswilerensis]
MTTLHQAPPTCTGMLDLSRPADALTALRKIYCSTRDARPVIYGWSGRVWSRREGEPDRLLFRVEGMNVRQCTTLDDPRRGSGFRVVSRELMLYLDPVSGEPLHTWDNPWTGAKVEVRHVANDPVNLPPVFERDAEGRPAPTPLRVQDERVFLSSEIPLFYSNPLAGDYQDMVGNHYHAMEIFNFTADRQTLLDRTTDTADACLSWVRIAPWLPFMRMGSRPGLMVFNATGQRVASIAQLPGVLRQSIASQYPAYASPPPLDDQRPNVTSWTAVRSQE